MNSQAVPLEISCGDVRDLRQSSADFLFVDCRERNEHDLVRIEGATLLPMSEFAARIGELSPHQGRRVVVHCHHGGRSLRVVQWLRQQGFSQAQSMAGGIDQWAVDIEPGLTRY